MAHALILVAVVVRRYILPGSSRLEAALKQIWGEQA